MSSGGNSNCRSSDRIGQFEKIKNSIQCFSNNDVKNGLNPVFLILPENGTMGKRLADKNPYELNEFKKGFAYFSLDTNFPVIPIVQIVDEDANFYTKILKDQA